MSSTADTCVGEPGSAPAGTNVDWVYEAGLCHGCGTCAGVCPAAAIAMEPDPSGSELRPRVRDDACTHCGLCLRVCPGIAVDFGSLNADVFGCQPDDPLLGVCRAAWVAHTADEDLRFRAASGGAVTELLAFALDEGLVDGAVVVRAASGSPFRPVAVIARDREQLVAATGSRYCPVAVNTSLRDIRAGGGRFAVAGLPCHVHGVRKAAQADARLRASIVLSFGLFCGKVPTFLATEYYLSRKGLRPADVAAIHYRGEGWPGMIRVELKDGTMRLYPKRVSMRHVLLALQHNAAFSFQQFRPWRCLTCCDETAELADISCGDPWLPRFLRTERVGRTVVVARSERGQELVEAAVGAGRLVVAPLTPMDVVKSQQAELLPRKAVAATFCAARVAGKQVPRYAWAVPCEQRASLPRRLGSLASVAERWLGRRRWAWPLILPHVIVRTALRLAVRTLTRRRQA